jgi:hypothetical protein
MKGSDTMTRNHNLLFLFLPPLLTIAIGGASCDQPRIDCTTGHNGFAATYVLKPGSKEGTGTCDTLKGEIIGLEKYNPSKRDDETEQDLTKATLAIQSNKLGQLARDAKEAGATVTGSVLSIGDFTSIEPDDQDVCHVPTLSEAEQDVPELSPTRPAVDIKYKWSNVRIYTTEAYPGTEIVADLTYTEDGCSASYSVTGLWPAVSCRVNDVDGNPIGVDPGLCDPKADPAAGRPTGSGINPDFKDNVICDPDLRLCVLKSPPPELR